MAEFMAGVLDHSNARPAGITMQATNSSGLGSVSATLAVTYRDDSLASMVDVSIKVFDTEDSGGFNEDTGECETAGACDWSDSEELTDDSGNIFLGESVDADDGDGEIGNMTNSETFYAWMGDEENDEFNVNTTDHGVSYSHGQSQRVGDKNHDGCQR